MKKSGMAIGGAVLVVAVTAVYLWQRQDTEPEATAKKPEMEAVTLPTPAPALPPGASDPPAVQPAAVQPQAVQTQASVPESSQGPVTPNSIVASNDRNGDGVVTKAEAEASGR